MEDLSQSGQVVNLVDGLRLEQVLNIAEALASLHAYSLEHEGKQILNTHELGIGVNSLLMCCNTLFTQIWPQYRYCPYFILSNILQF